MRRRLTASRFGVIFLGAALGGCDRPAEYRVADQLAGLLPGAVLVVRGQVAGDVQRIERRGETTFVRLSMARAFRPLRVGDAVRTRELGLDRQIGLEVLPAARAGPELRAGGWLRSAPAEPHPAATPGLPGRELPPPYTMPWHRPLPLAPPLRPQPVLVSLRGV